jgi:putative acetyltransferase
MIRIIDFEKKHAADFKRLNQEWLENYQLMESHDLEVINDPVGKVIERGGFIFLAETHGIIIGTAGLMKGSEHEFELVKMSVATSYQGLGIGKSLLEKCLAKAKEQEAKRLFLYSNSRLHRAIALYSKYGFKHVSVFKSPLVTADVKMEYQF